MRDGSARYDIRDFSKLKKFNAMAICREKRRYDLIDTAYEAAVRVNDSNANITIYRCPVCKWWHYGRNKYVGNVEQTSKEE